MYVTFANLRYLENDAAVEMNIFEAIRQDLETRDLHNGDVSQ